MPDDPAIGGLLCALVIGLPIETLIGAVFLRAAVALYNKMAGGAASPNSVPEPAFGKAMGITFATSFAQIIVGSLIVGLGPRPEPAGAGGKGVDVAHFISFPVSLLIMTALLSARLPTNFGRAILVTLCYLLVVLLVVGVLVSIAVLLFGVALR